MFPIVTDCDTEYTVNEALRKLPAYDTSQGIDQLLDISRIINESGNYFYVGAAFPFNTTVGPSATVNGSIPLTPGTYVTSINAYMDDGTATPAGFKLKLYDKGTKASIFYGDYILNRLVASDMSLQYGPGTGIDPNGPFGQGYLLSPFIVTPPGVLNWELTNMAGVQAVIQVLLNCASPINNLSLGTKTIKK